MLNIYQRLNNIILLLIARKIALLKRLLLAEDFLKISALPDNHP